METLEERRLSVVIRNAWATVRLNLIHQAVKDTIVEIEDGARQDGLSAGTSQADTERQSASQMALRAIIKELQEEAGLTDTSSLAASEAVAPGLHWGLLYSEFLERYRLSAASSLSRKFGAPLPTPVASPT